MFPLYLPLHTTSCNSAQMHPTLESSSLPSAWQSSFSPESPVPPYRVEKSLLFFLPLWSDQYQEPKVEDRK